MKVLFAVLCGVLFGIGNAQAVTLSQWTFETSQPGVVTLPAAPGAGVSFPSMTAEAGITPGLASGLHAGAATYSSPSGNGSVRSFSVNTWAVNDFFQFVLPTTGYQDVGISFDQTSSSTGPRDFSLTYGTDGVTFTPFGSYTVLQNGLTPNANWNSTTYQSAYTFSFDLSAVSAIENVPTVYFRLVNTSTLTPSGGTVATTGTDRVDNFTVTATVVPEPSSAALMGLGLLGASFFRRRN